MKLRNKKTGEITRDNDWDFVGLVLKVDHADYTIEMDDRIEYHSLAELNADWEDYTEPAEPLIKDEKIKKLLGEVVEFELAVNEMSKRLDEFNKDYVKACEQARITFANDNEAYNKCIQALNNFMENYRGI